VRELACQFLSVKGYIVLAASGGAEALEIASKHDGTIHVVLSDMVMPQMSGGELVRRLQQNRPEIKIAFMSGYSEFSRGGLDFPQAPVLQKPFSPASIVELIRSALSKGVAQETDGTVASLPR